MPVVLSQHCSVSMTMVDTESCQQPGRESIKTINFSQCSRPEVVGSHFKTNSSPALFCRRIENHSFWCASWRNHVSSLVFTITSPFLRLRNYCFHTHSINRGVAHVCHVSFRRRPSSETTLPLLINLRVFKRTSG